MEKRSEARLFYLFAHLHLLSSDPFSSLILSLLLSSDSSHLCFSVHIVGSLTSKLPSVGICMYYLYLYSKCGNIYIYIHAYISICLYVYIKIYLFIYVCCKW